MPNHIARIRICSDRVTVTFQVGAVDPHTVNITCPTPRHAHELSHMLQDSKTFVTVECPPNVQRDLW